MAPLRPIPIATGRPTDLPPLPRSGGQERAGAPAPHALALMLYHDATCHTCSCCLQGYRKAARMSWTASDGRVFNDRQAYRKYEFELSYSFRGRTGETLLKSPGSIDGQPFDLSDLTGCEVNLLDHTDQVQIDGLQKCRCAISSAREGSRALAECWPCRFVAGSWWPHRASQCSSVTAWTAK